MWHCDKWNISYHHRISAEGASNVWPGWRSQNFHRSCHTGMAIWISKSQCGVVLTSNLVAIKKKTTSVKYVYNNEHCGTDETFPCTSHFVVALKLKKLNMRNPIWTALQWHTYATYGLIWKNGIRRVRRFLSQGEKIYYACVPSRYTH